MITIFKSTTSSSEKKKQETNNRTRAQRGWITPRKGEIHPDRLIQVSPFTFPVLFLTQIQPKIGRCARFIRERRTSIIKESQRKRSSFTTSFSLSFSFFQSSQFTRRVSLYAEKRRRSFRQRSKDSRFFLTSTVAASLATVNISRWFKPAGPP